jgi:ABC-2 type transport system permease protein
MFVMPALLIAFSAGGVTLGIAQAYAGLTVLFAYFAVNQAGFSYFREHGWGTWTRLRTTPARPSVILLAKLLPYYLLGVVQALVLFLFCRALLGLTPEGSVVQLLALAATVPLSMIAITVLLLSLTRHIQQFSTLANLLAVLMGGVAGAFAPSGALPSWTHVLGRATPQYWAIEGLRANVDQGDWGAVLPNIGVLVAMSIVIGAVGARRLDLTAPRESWGTN